MYSITNAATRESTWVVAAESKYIGMIAPSGSLKLGDFKLT
jgi:hypothetical protein